MERFISEKLLSWKSKSKHKPLLITGVRQCGKTYSIKQFGQREFASLAYLNLEKERTAADVFSYDFNVKRIISELSSIVLEQPIIPGQTLLVLDEIQACPQAITALKYFCEDMPELHVAAAGSLLGVALKAQQVSFPVGKVERCAMYPLSFAEFVCACGHHVLLDGLQRYSLDKEWPGAYTSKLTTLLKQYYIIGGMPEAVQTWIDSGDYRQIDELQQAILNDYAHDFAKHPPLIEVPRIRLIWDSIPAQLAKENSKFIFSHVKKGARAKNLEDALEWLADAGLIYKLALVSHPELPLAGMADNSYFKAYMADVGLLRQKAGVHYRTILSGDDNYIRFKGALAENFVLTQLKAMGIDSWFWRNDASAEVGFITDCEGWLTPLEVKAADNTKAKSLRLFCQRYSPRQAVKLSLRNAGVNLENGTKVWSLPLYAIHRLKECISAASADGE